MELKKYLDFVNEKLSKKELFDHEKIIKSLNRIIKDKVGFNLLPSTYIDFDESKVKRIIGDTYNKEDGHDLFISFTFPRSNGVIDIKKRLNFPFDFNVYAIEPEEEYHVNQEYIISYNLEEMLNSPIGKSLQGVNKYKL